MLNKTLQTIYRYFDPLKKQMFEKPEPWQDPNDIGYADALYRTSLAYIAYGDQDLRTGVLRCFTSVLRNPNCNNNYYCQASRCFPRIGEADVSRDQVILALAALKFNGDQVELNDIGLHLRYRLSNRYIMTPALWLWIRLICNKGEIYNTLFGIMELIELLPSVLWSKFIRKVLGYDKEYDNDWYLATDPTTGMWYKDIDFVWKWRENMDANNSIKLFNYNQMMESKSFLRRFFAKTTFPEYALHLTSWLVFFMKEGKLKRMLESIVSSTAEDQNYQLQLMMRRYVALNKIEEYKPKWGNRWSSRFDGTEWTYELQGDNAIYNVLDKDILLPIRERVWKINKK